ncbi:MAG: OmpA family protein [Prevotella sp.]|nr:OmpA family protein [Prevotella sp.]
MKKLFIILAFAGVTMTSMAQDADPVQKYSVATNSFWSNWFIQVGANWDAFYSGQEHGQGLERSPFKGFRSHVGAAVALGKWFTPGIGLRTKLQGIWGKQVYNPRTGVVDNDNDFWLLNEHVLFNVSNLLCGYNPKRVWNFIPFAGAGFGRSMTTNLYGMDLSAGILNTFRLSKHVLLNLEVGYVRTEGDVDGYDLSSLGNRGWDSHDNMFYGELGLTFNLGKATWNKVPDVDALKALHQSQLDALNAQLNDANAENARLKKLLAEQKPAPAAEPKTVKEFVGTPVNVFFNLDKYNIASQKDLVNVQGIAKYAKDNGANLLVTGYADSATGKAPHNQWLSEKRAETVANELVKMGVSRDKIETAAKGGVNDLSPISFNRRATVQVK